MKRNPGSAWKTSDAGNSLLYKAAIHRAEIDRVDIRARYPGIRERAARHLDDQRFDIAVVVPPEFRVRPTDDAARHPTLRSVASAIVATSGLALYPDMGSLGAIVRIILCLATVLCAFPAAAASVVVTLESFGLVGVWAIDCTKELTAAQPGFRIIVAEPPGGTPTHTTISVDAGVKTTVRSTVQAAVRLPPGQLRLTLRIFGGDRDGFPLPSPTTNTFEQTFEMPENGRLRMTGTDPIFFQRCRN